MPKASTRIDSLLVELYRAGTHYLPDYPWESEADRWAELLVCNLVAGLSVEPSTAKQSVHSLMRLNLLSVEGLASASAKELTFITHVFSQHGCDSSKAQTASASLVALAKAVKSKWNGHLQRFLREYGEKMVDQLQQMVMSTGVGEKESRKTAVLWLQNVANIPILLPEDDHIRDFCKKHKITKEELVDSADRLDLNVAVLDDLLALEASAGESSRPTPRQKRAKAAKNKGSL